MRYFEEVNIYVVSLDDDGSRMQLRAVDGIAPATGCSVEWDMEDPAGATQNPDGRPGSFRDPCSMAVWFVTGDALAGTSQPMRTFHITQPPPEDAQGRRIVEVEVIGRPNPLEE